MSKLKLKDFLKYLFITALGPLIALIALYGLHVIRNGRFYDWEIDTSILIAALMTILMVLAYLRYMPESLVLSLIHI